jgi:hypothetical protein
VRVRRAPPAEVRGLRTGAELVLGGARDSHASRENRERERRPESPNATCHVRVTFDDAGGRVSRDASEKVGTGDLRDA